VDIAANTVNAFLLANAIYCHRLLNATIPIRKALVFFITLIGMTVSYHLLLFLIDAFSYGAYSFAAAALIIALFTLLCYERLRNGLQTWLDRTLFGEQYNYRETLKDYSRLMTSILDLDELASSTLLLLVKALHVNGVILFLPDEEGHFYAHDQLGYSREVLAMRVDKLSVIVRWLSRQNEAILSWQEIENLPEFRGLWQREKDHLQQLGAELLVGINFQNNLQGILLLADKKSKSPYTDDDKALLVTLTNQAAVVLQNAQIYREVRSQAVRDDLTKLYNFRYLQEFLDNEISRCAKSGLCFSVILLDLDFFKTYNDVYGHLAGDDALIKIAQALTESIRVSDVAARYGGDEFAVILPETDLEEAKEIAEKIKERVCLNFQSSGSSLLTTSLGVAAYPEHGQTKQQLIASADRALYKAKNFGRNHITLGTSAEIAVASGVSETASQAEKDFLKEQVKGMQLDTIYTLAAAIYARDNYTYQHSKMVTQYAVALAEALGLSYEHKQIINNAAMLHDIGKIGIPENVLNKPGPLTASEREMINYHVTIGEAILNQMPYLRGLAAIIRHHHEQYDGNGYPDRLKKENIPLEARILAIADAFHAMTSDRPYRKARSKEDALREMTALAGSQFDPHLVPVFVKMIKTQNL
jgi:diguanylate cyclase (GGDEF)-like protein/putative nucleotidyltransferase with HDIG domain